MAYNLEGYGTMRGLLLAFLAVVAYGGIGGVMANLSGKDWHLLVPFR